MMRLTAILGSLLLLTVAVMAIAPTAAADSPVCLPFKTTFALPAGPITDDYGNAAWFTGTKMISPTEWSGTAVPVVCGQDGGGAPGMP